MIEFAERELSILRKLPDNENIIKFYEGKIIQIEDHLFAIFVFEFCDEGSLLQYMTIKKEIKFSEKEIMQIFNQICQFLINNYKIIKKLFLIEE